MMHVAQVWPGAKPFVARVANGMHSRCQYPWCTHPDFADNEVGVKAHLSGSPPGTMHASHTELAHKYDGGRTEYYNDGTPESVIEVRAHTDDAKLDVSQPMSLDEAFAYARQGLGWAICITPDKTKYTKWVVAKIPKRE